VQHCIRERAAEVWALLQSPGAAVYVAGSAQKMPEDVAEAFRDVAQTAGGKSVEQAAAWLRQLELSKRYNVETWS
jgi:sulfite reductase alpha subunit-like flavoprotein